MGLSLAKLLNPGPLVFGSGLASFPFEGSSDFFFKMETVGPDWQVDSEVPGTTGFTVTELTSISIAPLGVRRLGRPATANQDLSKLTSFKVCLPLKTLELFLESTVFHPLSAAAKGERTLKETSATITLSRVKHKFPKVTSTSAAISTSMSPPEALKS